MTDLDSARLDGRVALVTGASGGIGAAICRELAARGAAVVVHRHRGETTAAELVAAIHEIDGRAVVVAADLRDPSAIKPMFAEAREQLGPVDILVNNAGVAHEGLAVMTSEERWTELFDLNAKAVFLCTRSFVRHRMRARAPGAVVNVASLAALEPSPGLAAYAASKAAVVSLTRTLALELATHDIRVNAVAPGPVDAGMFHRLSASSRAKIVTASRSSGGRITRAEQVARVVAYLASDAASGVSGAVIPIENGSA
ncbi:MAG: SDR family NAD(P)-dependent oxidoreductase [Enhygromyxa sp.]